MAALFVLRLYDAVKGYTYPVFNEDGSIYEPASGTIIQNANIWCMDYGGVITDLGMTNRYGFVKGYIAPGMYQMVIQDNRTAPSVAAYVPFWIDGANDDYVFQACLLMAGDQVQIAHGTNGSSGQPNGGDRHCGLWSNPPRFADMNSSFPLFWQPGTGGTYGNIDAFSVPSAWDCPYW